MRITIMALGSRGDVLPYAVLGKGLQEAGHRVLVSTFESFRPLVTDLGLDFHPVKGDAETILRGATATTMIESGVNPVRLVRGVLDAFGALVDDYSEAFSAGAMLESEAIVNQLPASLFGYDLAERLGVPYFSAAVIPLTPTRAWSLSLFPQISLGGWANLLTYHVAWQAGWQALRGGVNRFRARIGLPPAPFWGHYAQIAARRVPVLNGFSEHVVPRPPDWGDHVHITGYWQLASDGWQPPPALVDFLGSGPPPVFIGFGSMPVRDPARVTQVALDALRLSGQRGVLHTGWAGLAEADLPDTVFKINYAPYDWLFPRMAAVVHHGGSGTTGWSVWSGVPPIIVPFAADQPYWAGRLVALGVGPEPVPFKNLTAEKLAYAIRVAVEHEPMRQRAARLGEQIRAEDGVARAVAIIERHLGI